MKRCPTCKKTFTDHNLTFCTEDGTPLVLLDTSEEETTVVRPSGGDTASGTSGPIEPSSASESSAVPPYQPPVSYTPRDFPSQEKRRTWPWVVGILALVFLVFAGLGIAAVILIPNMMRAANTNSRSLNSNNQRLDSNSNLNDRSSNPGTNSADGNENSNTNSAVDDTTSPPTDQKDVLQGLTDLEQEWTVANINADKKKLDRILADDYVGTGPNGKPQGKAEYLKTATRDTAIQKWDFDDLKLSLTGDRATLTGTIRLEVKDERGQNQSVGFRFTDKFVWREGRWQATGSVVTPVQQGTPA